MNIKAAIVLLLLSLASPISAIAAQIPRDKQAQDLKPENAALVGKWEDRQGRHANPRRDSGPGRSPGIEVVLADTKGTPLLSGRAEKVLAIGGFARTARSRWNRQWMEEQKTFKTLVKMENENCSSASLMVLTTGSLLLAKLPDDGRPP